MIDGNLATKEEIEAIKKDITTKLNTGYDFNFVSGYLSGLLKAGEDSIGIDFKSFSELQNSLIDKETSKLFDSKFTE